MLVEDLGTERNGFHRVDGSVSPHLKGQLVIIGDLADAGVLDCVVNL